MQHCCYFDIWHINVTRVCSNKLNTVHIYLYLASYLSYIIYLVASMKIVPNKATNNLPNVVHWCFFLLNESVFLNQTVE